MLILWQKILVKRDKQTKTILLGCDFCLCGEKYHLCLTVSFLFQVGFQPIMQNLIMSSHRKEWILAQHTVSTPMMGLQEPRFLREMVAKKDI